MPSFIGNLWRVLLLGNHLKVEKIMKKIAQVTANSVSLGNVDALGTELSVTQTERSISLNVSLQQVFHEVETSS